MAIKINKDSKSIVLRIIRHINKYVNNKIVLLGGLLWIESRWMRNSNAGPSKLEVKAVRVLMRDANASTTMNICVLALARRCEQSKAVDVL